MNKEQEIQFFQRFLRCMYKDESIIFKSREKPDFKLITLNKTIGVELTQILNPKQRARQILIKSIGDKVVDILYKKFNRPFHLNLTLVSGLRIRKSQINQYSKILSSQILALIGEKPVETLYSFDLDSISTNELTRFTIVFSKELTEPYFSESAAGLLSNLTQNDFNNILVKKERALKKYEVFDEQWLVIVEGDFLAGSVDQILLDEEAINSDFDQIFIFRLQTHEIVKLTH